MRSSNRLIYGRDRRVIESEVTCEGRVVIGCVIEV